MLKDLDRTLEKYAELIVKVGLNLRAGQRLLVIKTPLEAAPLARHIAASAYKAGARLVDVIYNDDQILLQRFNHAPRDSFEEYPGWLPQLIKETFENGDALLSFNSDDPDLLKGQDPALVGTYFKTRLSHIRKYQDLLMVNASNWSVSAYPAPSWAAKVFPDLQGEERVSKLWQAIAKACRLDADDPVAAWREHDRQLHARRELLNRRQYTALKYRAPGTDLTVGLPEGHRWMGGHATSGNGIDFIPNLPTEEVFTLPHKDRIEGTVRASLPLSYQGALIENFQLSFKSGRVVDFKAERGEEFLREILDTDEGARRLGEVALVPQNSPIASSRMLFFNTLFDENAASHLALGRAYRFTMQGGEDLTDEEFAVRGGNYSMAHVDFMIGSDEMDIDGVLPDGREEPLMRAGNWAFEV
jgi:aminopeptidase